MSGRPGIGQRLDAFVARYVDADLPESTALPWYVAPLPEWLENVALRLVWLLVALNLAGTAFGFVYYFPQLSRTAIVMWPIVPVSPLATLYIAVSLTAWRLGFDGRIAQILHVLAFFGCLKYGLWTVVVQLFVEDASVIPFPFWQFLVWSHVGMILQAFLVSRYATFPLYAVAVATAWFTFNDVLDYFVVVAGGPHHTWLNVLVDNGIDRTLPAFDHMAGIALVATVLATFLALATRIEILRRRDRDS